MTSALTQSNSEFPWREKQPIADQAKSLVQAKRRTQAVRLSYCIRVYSSRLVTRWSKKFSSHPPTASMHVNPKAFFVLSMTMGHGVYLSQTNTNSYCLYLYGSTGRPYFYRARLCTYEMYTIWIHLYITYGFLVYSYGRNTRTSPSTDSCNVSLIATHTVYHGREVSRIACLSIMIIVSFI